jgi:two-component system phosphate regulon sensor histidine kinase PhoR
MADDNLNSTELAYAQAQAYGRDVARLYAAEKDRRRQLETTTQKLQAIFDTAPNGLAVVDNALTIVEANPRFLALFQRTADIIGQPLTELLPVEKLLETMRLVKDGVFDLGDLEIEITEPVLRTLLVNLSPLSDEQGWVLIIHDLTERKRLEGLKDEFVNIAAHELRTPLAGVMGFVGVLQEELKQADDPMMTNLMELILHSTERLRIIIDELVDFAATQRSTAHDLHISDVDLNQLLQKTVDLLRHQIEAKNITCHFQVPSEKLIVQGDRFILGEVIYQLLNNAIVFNKPEGKIAIRTGYLNSSDASTEEFAEGTTLIEIEDTGIGIPRTDLEKVFDKFYQVEEHLTRGVGGLGLGLTIARRGVEQHGGQLTVTSQLEQGSIFRILLPPITQFSDVSIDKRLDVAHQQMLTYAKDMAQAVASQRRMSKRMNLVKTLSVNLIMKLEPLFSVVPQTGMSGISNVEYTGTLDQVQQIVKEIVKLSEQEVA